MIWRKNVRVSSVLTCVGAWDPMPMLYDRMYLWFAQLHTYPALARYKGGLVAAVYIRKHIDTSTSTLRATMCCESFRDRNSLQICGLSAISDTPRQELQLETDLAFVAPLLEQAYGMVSSIKCERIVCICITRMAPYV